MGARAAIAALPLLKVMEELPRFLRQKADRFIISPGSSPQCTLQSAEASLARNCRRFCIVLGALLPPLGMTGTLGKPRV